MADVNAEVIQNAAQDTYGLDYPGALRRATGLNLDPNGICLALWGKEFNEAGVEMLSVLSQHALLLPGTSGAYASTPDHASLDIVGDIDIRVEYVDSYALTALPTRAWVSKYLSTGNQRSYMLRHNGGTAVKELLWTTGGISSVSPNGSVAGALVNNPGAARCTLEVNVASQYRVTWYTASSRNGPWTQVQQQTLGAAATSIFSGSALLLVGAASDGTVDPFKGRITYAEVRSGVGGTIVANPDFSAQAPGTTSFADSTGKTWTINGTAQVV